MSDTEITQPQPQELTKKQRSSNFELLRIICMILIVAHHFSVHSTLSANASGFNRFIFESFAIGGKMAVNVFVLISGYFMVKSEFKFKKLLLLLGQIFFYSIIIYTIFCFVGYYKFNIGSFLNILFTFNKTYWFMACYLSLYALSPFINKLIKKLKQNELLLLYIIVLLIPTEILKGDMGRIIWFISLYIAGAYIQLYPNKLSNSLWINLVGFLVSYATILLLYTQTHLNYSNMTDILCLISSLTLFCTFKNIKIPHCKFINFISSATLGVYLIHDNPWLSPVLWTKWLNVTLHTESKYFWLFAICAVAVVFVICTLIEILRILTKKGIIKLINKKDS